MTTIDFYFNAADRLQVACRLAGKAASQKLRVLVYCPQAELAQRVDRLLWTWPATGFVPHCRNDDPLAGETPVILAAEVGEDGPHDVMINLSDECPRQFERFARLLEIVSTDEQDRSAGRARYRFYRERGYAIENHDLGTSGTDA